MVIESTVVACAEQVSVDIGAEDAILNVKMGMYFGLDAVDTLTWKQVSTSVRVDQLRDLLAEYDVESRTR